MAILNFSDRLMCRPRIAACRQTCNQIEWSDNGAPTTVEWRFTARADGTTFISVTNSGFHGAADDIVAQAIGSTEGFTFVLAGLKALLEHDIDLRLIPDRFPDGLAANP